MRIRRCHCSPKRPMPACLAAFWAAVVLSLPLFVQADEFVLASGGRLRGELVAEQAASTQLQIRTSAGVIVRLPKSALRERIREKPALAEYQERAPQTADTVEDQWKLAEWCRQQGLSAERRLALQRIVELNPQHEKAHYGLGFAFIDGRWVLPAEARRQQGLEYYRGRWRTIQEIELLEEKSRLELAHKEWLQKLVRWRRDLDGPKARETIAAHEAISDPIAIEPLAEMISREKTRPVKMLYVSVLGKIDGPTAVAKLVQVSLLDPDDEIFHQAVDLLVRKRPPHLADPYIVALRDPDNLRVNRAGLALGRIGDPTAISPLIDALTTTHARTLPGIGGGKGDTISQSFNKDGGVGLKTADGPKTLIYRVQNQPVLDALTKLTGASFGYDSQAWRYWHAQEKAAQAAAASVSVSSRRE